MTDRGSKDSFNNGRSVWKSIVQNKGRTELKKMNAACSRDRIFSTPFLGMELARELMGLLPGKWRGANFTAITEKVVNSSSGVFIAHHHDSQACRTHVNK